jgi:6-phosphogluconolactonase (cycloisomerase 2 family)
MNKRQFNLGLAGAAISAWVRGAAGQGAPAAARTVVYNSCGDTMTHYDVDVAAATLTRRASIKLPSVVQYAWPHPSNRYLYVSTTDSDRGSRGITGAAHTLCALRVGTDGALAFHGTPQILRQRPINNSVDRSGNFALTCYNAPPHLSVHRINPDGTLGAPVEQPANLDLGIFPHQIRTLPSNRNVVMVTRGNNPTADKPADPGALKFYHFNDGRLSPFMSLAVGGHGGLAYGPRHLDFHPSRPWAYVLVELQNQLHMHRMLGDEFEHEPAFVKPATANPPIPGIIQVTGAIHVHPRGHVVYASNRVSATTDPDEPFPYVAGENNIAVFAIDQNTGEPRPVQFADPHGFHVRAFSVDPSGRLLIAATMAPMALREGTGVRIVPAGLSLFRIQSDGRLDFANKYDVDLAAGVQQMWVRSMTLPA